MDECARGILKWSWCTPPYTTNTGCPQVFAHSSVDHRGLGHVTYYESRVLWIPIISSIYFSMRV